MPLDPPQTWGFQAKKDPSQAIILDPLRTWQGVPITKARCLKRPPGPINPCEIFQLEITATRVTLEANNQPMNPPQTWGFQAKKDPLQRLFWTHCAFSMPPITKG